MTLALAVVGWVTASIGWGLVAWRWRTRRQHCPDRRVNELAFTNLDRRLRALETLQRSPYR